MPRSTRPGTRLPEAPLNGFNGSAHSADAKPADTSTVVPLTSETPSTTPREDPSWPGPSLGPSAKLTGGDGASPASTAKNGDAQRIIAMPSRLGAASAPGTPSSTAPSTGSGMNSASVSSLGPRPVTGGRQSFRPTSPLRDPDAGASTATGPTIGTSKTGETERDSVTARSTDAGFKLGDSVIRNKRDDAPGDEDKGVLKEPQGLRDEPAKPSFGSVADMPRPVDAFTPGAAPARADAAATSEASSEDSLAKRESPFAKPTTSGGSPSDALVDAVVALVHKEPDSLSVFTSGSAFIHGVVEEAGAAPVKPGPNMARKLDRSAAELLRPMLRQWLSDNMPRIVEEALRSELTNSQDPAKETDKE
jgi:cell pole-organizing protein PopZ